MQADPLHALNRAQREAVLAGAEDPLLVIAGAGSGKTTTLAHRIARLVQDGADPRRVLLLTFSRRAAIEMIRRAQRVARSADLPWAGTFHAIGSRLLRLHALPLGLDPAFTVLDRGDAADMIDLIRAERGLGRNEAPEASAREMGAVRSSGRRFPKKATCLAIYSRTVNARAALETVLDGAYPWCREHAAELRALFGAYVEAKLARHVLDYDDLLLWWWHAMAADGVAAAIRARFDHVLVDEYQDTNALQAEIVVALSPSGRGVTAVGDDAQAIYSFRAATVHNILAFPRVFTTPARVVALEDNYRSTAAIVAAANAVIELSPQRHAKTLRATRGAAEDKPVLAIVADELGEVDYVIERVLAHREAGLLLRDQAVLMRAAHHSDLLELELGRRRIPFVKYGGLKFLEAAHVKDLLAFLRWAENPVDPIAAFRVAQLLPGIGPAFARRAADAARAGVPALAALSPPAAARAHWPALCELLVALATPGTPWIGQIGRIRAFYEPLLVELYDAAEARLGDLAQLEAIAGTYTERGAFLEDLALDPPSSTGDFAGPPALDEDWLVLSTIHSAKGQEWRAVFVLDVIDGRIPSDLGVGTTDELEEERRLLYVAMTRARDHLHLVQPLRMYVEQQHRHGDRHVYAPRSRFLPDAILDRFERVVRGRSVERLAADESPPAVDVAARLRAMW